MTDYMLVPVEPTAEMIEAACDEEQRPLPMWIRVTAIYKAMLAAAPDHIADTRKMVAAAVQGEPVGFCEDTALSLAERTFSTEINEQLAEDIIQYALRLHNRYTAPQSAHAEPEVRKLGIMGAAFDPPSIRRAYTYSDQPNNTTAWKLGRAACKERSGGDFIDYGLQLLQHLQDEGFGVFEIDESDPSPQPAEQQPDMDQLGGFLAWLDAFVAVSEQAGIDDHEEAWTWPAPPTDPGFFDPYPKLTAGDLRAVHAALAAHRKGGEA